MNFLANLYIVERAFNMLVYVVCDCETHVTIADFLQSILLCRTKQSLGLAKFCMPLSECFRRERGEKE